MYLPVDFRETDRSNILNFLREHSFGLCVSSGPSGLQATPVPFVVVADGETLKLHAHVSRGNAQWKDLEVSGECLLVFQGVHGYVTPTWYPTMQTTGEHVPTWNYEMVQIQGSVAVTTDREWLMNHLSDLTEQHEGERDVQWDISDAPSEYMERMLTSVVGFEVTATDVQAKWKMNQNRLPQDAEGAWRGLSNPNDPHVNVAVAARVRELNDHRFAQNS